ncbi:hypothetical protein PVK06_016924 [Gossypium arboreum]|uniref:Uncharacterized protein n=1 Tax=Gossypium arboreum TaxID=29729 RepID=A0ABR0Q1R2_GOSAR|nr:hypothetical protein PVK06_016924 [Gossypium arboreum]
MGLSSLTLSTLSKFNLSPWHKRLHVPPHPPSRATLLNYFSSPNASYPPNPSPILLPSLPSALLPLFPTSSDVSLLSTCASPPSSATSTSLGSLLTLCSTLGRTSAIDRQLKWPGYFRVVIMSID